MKKLITIILPALISFLLYNCGQPNEPDKIKYKDPREMTWTADTIDYPLSAQTMMQSIWAHSPDDIWICGHNDRSIGNLWHYEGSEWKEVHIQNYIVQSALSFNKIEGKSSDNIWLVGRRSPQKPGHRFEDLVIHYDGTTWTEHDLDTYSDIMGLYIDNNGKDVWMCGDNGLVANYNGKFWRLDTVNVPLLDGVCYYLKSVAVFDKQVHLLATVGDSQRQRNTYYHITGTMNNWSIKDSMVFSAGYTKIRWGRYGLYSSSFGVLYSYGQGGIWKWDGGNWNDELLLRYPIEGMHGVAEDYIYAAGQFGNTFFHDGISWNNLSVIINTPEPVLYTDVWTNGSETIIIGITTDGYPMKTVVWRGK